MQAGIPEGCAIEPMKRSVEHPRGSPHPQQSEVGKDSGRTEERSPPTRFWAHLALGCSASASQLEPLQTRQHSRNSTRRRVCGRTVPSLGAGAGTVLVRRRASQRYRLRKHEATGREEVSETASSAGGGWRVVHRSQSHRPIHGNRSYNSPIKRRADVAASPKSLLTKTKLQCASFPGLRSYSKKPLLSRFA